MTMGHLIASHENREQQLDKHLDCCRPDSLRFLCPDNHQCNEESFDKNQDENECIDHD